jgi:hypothetical protein
VAVRVAFTIALLSGSATGQPSLFEQVYPTGTPTTLSGELTVLYRDDFARGRSELMHVVRDERTGRALTVRFQDQAPRHWRTGTRISVQGRLVGAELYVAASETPVVALRENAAISSAMVAGEQRTLVIVANFTDATVECTVPDIRRRMFDDSNNLCVAALYRAASLGSVTFSGEVVGPFVLPFSRDGLCDISAWAASAQTQATAAGVNVSDFSRLVYVMPQNSCAAAGYGTVGGAPSHAWVFTCHLNGVFAHELGHNLGLDHAATPESEYGDTTDPMAFSEGTLRGLNAPHLQQMGWLPETSLQVLDQDGLIAIAPLATDPTSLSGPRVLAIGKPDTQEYYDLSYRMPLGFDQFIDSSYHERLSIHRYKGDGSSTRTWLLAGLADGETFSDEPNGIAITLDGHGSSYAMVRVVLTPTCVMSSPTVAVTPLSQTGSPGSTVSYTLAVTNTDSSLCPASSVNLSALPPAGWSVDITPASLSLDPGHTAQATLHVTSPNAAPAGSHDIVVTGTHAAGSSYRTTSTVSYNVLGSCVRSTPAINATPPSQSATPGGTVQYSLVVTNTDSSGCPSTTFAIQLAAPSGWSATASIPSIVLAPAQTAQSPLVVTSHGNSAIGSHSVTVNVSDGSTPAHGASTSITYLVTAAADTTPPSAPVNLTAVAIQKQKQIRLSWNAATDNVAVTGYRIHRNGQIVGTVAGTAWTDSAPAGVPHTYVVVALDAAGNESPPSNSATATLPGGGKKP